MTESLNSPAPNLEEQPNYSQVVREQFEADPNRFGEITTPQDVEKVALDVLDSMPEGKDLMERISTARSQNREDDQAIRERNKLWRQVSIEVSLITGVEIEAADHEAQREAFRSNLNKLISNIDPAESDEEIMLKLGMIRPVQGSKGHVFTFPSRILPPYIKEQWNVYTGMIQQFDDAQRKLRGGIIAQSEFGAIDSIRRSAHNALANSIGEILQFDGWDLEKYRHLVEKMANEKFAEPTGEQAVYANLLRDQIIMPEHLTQLHRRISQHSGSDDSSH